MLPSRFWGYRFLAAVEQGIPKKVPRDPWELVASPWDRQSGIRFFPHPTGPQCSPKPLGLSKLDAGGRISPGKKAIRAFPWRFFRQRREEEQPGCCHHTELQAALRAWPRGKLDQESFGVRNPSVKQNPRWGLLHPVSFQVWKGARRDGRQGCPSAASVGCLGSRIPCFPSAGRCHDESAEWTLR